MTAPPPTSTPAPPPSRAVPVVASAAVIVLLGAGALGLVSVAFAQVRAQRERELQAMVALKIDQLSRWRQVRLGLATALAGDAAHELAEAHRGDTLQPLERELTAWLGGLSSSFDADAVAVAGPDGALRLQGGAGVVSTSPELRAGIARALALREPVLTDLSPGPAAGARLHAIAPIPRPGGGAPVGAVVLQLDPVAQLFPLVQTMPVPPVSGRALLLRAAGDGAEVVFPPGAGRGAPEARGAAALRAAGGGAGVLLAQDPRTGHAALSAFRPVPGTPWRVLISVDADEAFGPAKVQLAWALAALLGLALATAAAAALWWRDRRAAHERQRSTADAERQALQQRLALLSRWANDIVFLADEAHRIVEVNERASAVLGYAREELLGMSVRDLRDPALRAGFEAASEALLRDGGGLSETRYRRKDGSTFPVEVNVHVQAVAGGHRFHAVARDITERKRAVEALRASEARFRAAFEDASAGMVLLDRRGHILETNRALRDMLGHAEAELRGRPASAFVHPDELEAARRAFRSLRADAPSQAPTAQRHRRKDGSYADTLVRVSPLVDAQGGFEYALATLEDVTEKRLLEQKLRLADRMASVGTLAAGVAHEINNPLAFVLANLEYALRELRGEGVAQDVVTALEEAREGGARVREIVRDLKTFSRADDGAREVVDAVRVLRSTLSLASTELRARARLELALAPVPPVLASEHRLGQVFLNLLINAAQAIPEGRPEAHVIRVATAAAPDGRASIRVTDDGAGIPEDVRARIFDPFFTTKPVGVGTGLGLSICHGIVSGLGGEIRVESEAGRGSTFEVLLPPAAAAPETARPDARQLPLAPRARVLVIDDEPLVCRAVQRILSPPHQVSSRASGREALLALHGGQGGQGEPGYDLVLCDLMMPDMSGMELHERVSAAWPDLAGRFVFLTGGAFTPSAREFLERVPNPRVEKPFEPAALRDLVARLLAGG